MASSRNRPSPRLCPIALALVAAALFHAGSREARAWEKHQTLMPGILQGISESRPKTWEALLRPLVAPCPSEDLARYSRLASEFQLNPQPGDGTPPTAPEACARKLPLSGRDILASFVVDEPDMGMDRDLPYPPESYDPDHFQKWMGGSAGPSSQGFRHMYFGGWQLWHPLRTFQIPAGPVGMAPRRAELFAQRAREMIRAGGEQAAWGYRILGWAIHYVQDLAQPFHAVQIPDTRMVPWYALLEWPPGRGFNALVFETTRTISNYHWAYEEYTKARLSEERSPYAECLARPDERSLLVDDARRDEALRSPLTLADRVARASVKIATDVGHANVRFFGASLRQRGIDLRTHQGTPDYADLAVRPDLVEPRQEMTESTCRALSNAAWATRALIDWALQP